MTNARNQSYVEKFGKYIARRDSGWKCHYCHAPLVRKRKKGKPRKHAHRDPEPKIATVDHKTPLAHGGIDEPHNMVLCCRQCNREKGDMDYVEYYRITESLRQK